MTPDEYARRQSDGHLTFDASDLANWPDGAAGGSVLDLAALRAVADSGTEPARFSFVDAIVAFSRTTAIPEIVGRASVYPDETRTGKMQSFLSQLPVHFSYLELGEYSANPYLLAETAVNLVLFGGRLILAHNRRLYPGRKHFLRELKRAPDKPANLLTLAIELLQEPSIAHGARFVSTIEAFAEWPEPPEGRWNRFHRDREARELAGFPPLGEC